MKSDKRPLFTRGRVVKKESLDRLNDFPRQFCNLTFHSCSDGILYGFELTCKEEKICVSAGALKYLGEVILIEEEEIPFAEYDKTVCVKIMMQRKKQTEDFEWVPAELKADTNLLLWENELELGRFCLSRGAVLRSRYKGVEDFRTPHNTLDLTNVLYAGNQKATMSPKLLKLFGEELFSSGTANSLDEQFAFLCMNSDVIQRDCILWYLAKRLQESFQDYTNGEIYERLVRILSHRTVRTEVKGSAGRRGPSII